MNPDSERIKEIFAQALQRKGVVERERYLAEACHGDAELRQQLESLLASHEQAGDFLGQTMKLPPMVEFESERMGSVIGRYKLLEKIGEGGFGVVYLAEQQEPVQRKVALKIIKAGMDTREVIARFEAERQALALMDHPNIAKVLDAGTTEAKRPYFVMELVRGIPITDYCDQKNLSTNERLQLFIKVCQAVQHAHQKAVIHRDLKPSNILVTLHDGEPMPKVIDFGVAKALGQKLTEKTLFTSFRQMIGTPAYMSPEQAEMSGLDIDTRSDIYSLGVLLYELLTGATPFDKELLAKAALDEIRRMIRETEPPKPSTRLRTLGEKIADVAKHRRVEPMALSKLVRGDLDWIVMKCLEKDRQRRYETANGLGTDVKRFLNNEPVTAAAPGALYRTWKFARRHKTAFATTAAFGLLLAAGALVSTLEAVRARRAERVQTSLRRQAEEANALQVQLRRQAQEERAKAQSEAARSRQVAELLEDMLTGVGPSVALGRDTALLREILDTTAQRLTSGLKEQPEVKADLLYTIGKVYQDLGARSKAEEMHRKALDIYQGLFGDVHPKVANALDGLGNALNVPGKRQEAEGLLRRALTMQINFFGFGSAQEATVTHDLAYVLQWEGKLAEAKSLNRRSLEIRTKQFGEESVPVASSLNNLALVLQAEGNEVEAAKMLQRCLQIQRNVLGNDTPDVAMSLFNLAQLLRSQGNFSGAASLHAEALDIRRRVLGNDHPDVAASVGNLTTLLRAEGNLNSLSILYKQQLASLRSRLAPNAPELVPALEQLAVVQLALGEFSEMESIARECLQIRQISFPTDWRTSATRAMVGASLLGQKRYEEAIPELLSGYDGIDSQKGNLPEEGAHWMAEAARYLAQVYEATGRPDQAAQWHLRETNVQALVQGAVARGEALGHAQRGEWREAMASFTKAVQLDPAEHWNWFQLAPLLADTDPTAYDKHRHAMLSRFANVKDSTIAERTAKACLLLPLNQPDLAIVGQVAEAAGVATNNAWTHLTLALQSYRESRFAEATNWAQKALARANEKPYRDIAACMILAMSLYQLNQPQPALVALTRGDELFDTKLVKFEQKDLGPDFHDCFIAKNLRREADGLMSQSLDAGMPVRTNRLGLIVAARDTRAAPELLDLSDYYNAGFKGNWHDGDPQNDLAELRPGVRTLAGVQFDVRALIQLGNGPGPRLARFPAQVEGIQIHRKCRRVHFLHAVIYGWNPHGTQVGKYVLHFGDGQFADRPITFGEDVLDWWAHPDDFARASKIVIAWNGANGTSRQENKQIYQIYLYKSVWENPTPEVEVTALDFVSAQAGDCAPFLVAVTLEP